MLSPTIFFTSQLACKWSFPISLEAGAVEVEEGLSGAGPHWSGASLEGGLSGGGPP